MDSPKSRSNSTWKVYGSVLLLFLMLAPSMAILCFNCHSTQEPGCGDEFRIPRSDSRHIFECEGSCLKRRGKRSDGQVSRIEVQRSCREARKEGCYRETHNDLSQYTCVCNTNFCNSSPSVKGSLFFLFLCSFLSSFIIYKL